jgi:hypothetical protein
VEPEVLQEVEAEVENVREDRNLRGKWKRT